MLNRKLTKLDTGIVLADFVAVVIGEEHVRRQATLWCVGIFGYQVSTGGLCACRRRYIPFLRLPSTLDLALRVLVSFGILTLNLVSVSSEMSLQKCG
jgi:hypothetical protein